MQIDMDSKPPSPTHQVQIIAGKLFDSRNRRFLTNQLITVSPETGLITDVREISVEEQASALQEAENEEVIDLRSKTVIPGFVDAHVHFFLHPYSETSWEDQTTRESLVERTVRAVTHARQTLLAGFTTVRDLGTEGAEDADISLRKCISGINPLIPGPRYYCANRALVTTGSYGPKGVHHMNQEGVEGITGAEAVDGKDECRKVVRKQIGAGVDWIKVYGDYSPRSRLGTSSKNIATKAMATFHTDELEEIISTARKLGVKTAIHLKENDTALLLNHVAPHSIEHGCFLDDEKFRLMKQHGTFWVPTLAAYYHTNSEIWLQAIATFKRALKFKGLRIACGGDTGVFPHGDNALELTLMVSLGAAPTDVLAWATLGGWECVRGLQWEGKDGAKRIEHLSLMTAPITTVGENDMAFGVISKGFSADIIATDIDPEKDFVKSVQASNINFVMKRGLIFKKDGKEVSVI